MLVAAETRKTLGPFVELVATYESRNRLSKNFVKFLKIFSCLRRDSHATFIIAFTSKRRKSEEHFEDFRFCLCTRKKKSLGFPH